MASATVAPAALEARGDWLPSWPLVRTRLLELRRRTGLMVTVILLTAGLPLLILALRLLFHAVDPSSYGPAGSPSVFTTISEVMASFGFIAGAVLGAAAGSGDLTDGVFRHLVITGRSRVALYLARIPAALAILVPCIAVAFLALSLVTTFAGTAAPATIQLPNGVGLSTHLSQSQFDVWATSHPREAIVAFFNGVVQQGQAAQLVHAQLGGMYHAYVASQLGSLNPAANEMTKVGLWILCYAVVGLLVGLGLGSVMGQRTVPTIILIALQLVITPILANTVIPYFINGQRLVVGLALDQLRPAYLTAGQVHGPGHRVSGGGQLNIPPMPTWAMVAVISGWVVAWTVLGAWRMRTRDA